MVRPGRTAAPSSPSSAPEEAPRWLRYRCVKCGERVYSGFTASALVRAMQGGLVKPDFFHADCGVETPLDQADLRFEDGTPWEGP